MEAAGGSGGKGALIRGVVAEGLRDVMGVKQVELNQPQAVQKRH